MAPYKPAFTGNKLGIFREILRDASLVSKANKQLIMSNVASQMRETYEESGVFASDNLVDSDENSLYTHDNLVSVAFIAESVLASSRISLCIRFLSKLLTSRGG